jgi:hypothetical protein
LILFDILSRFSSTNISGIMVIFLRKRGGAFVWSGWGVLLRYQMAERVLSYKNCLIPPLVFGIVNNTFPRVIYRTLPHQSAPRAKDSIQSELENGICEINSYYRSESCISGLHECPPVINTTIWVYKSAVTALKGAKVHPPS